MRPNARRRKSSEPLPDKSDEDDEDFFDDAREQQAPPHKKNKKDWQTKDLEPTRKPIIWSEAEYEDNMAFCCKVCNCLRAEKEVFGNDDIIQVTEDGLWHRKCCHRKGPPFVDGEWMDPLHKARERIMYFDSKLDFAGKDKEKEEECVHTKVDKSEIAEKHRVAKYQLSELYNDDELEGRTLTET
jgi:hypothetical protein